VSRMKQERYYHNGEMADHCVVLLAHCYRNPKLRCSINQLSMDCGIPFASLYMILKDAKEDKYHSTLFIHALKHGYDFHVYDRWNESVNHYSDVIVMDVVKNDWTGYKFERE
jgi:hypothetical protein